MMTRSSLGLTLFVLIVYTSSSFRNIVSAFTCIKSDEVSLA